PYRDLPSFPTRRSSDLEELVEKLSEAFDRVVVGDGLAAETTMGPLNNKMQFDFVSGLVEQSRHQGRTILTKGKKLSPDTWDQGLDRKSTRLNSSHLGIS